MIIGKSTNASVEASATTTEASSDFNVAYVYMIANDGQSDIIFNFDASTTAAGAITVKPGESIKDFPRNASKLYYRSVYDTQPFRAWGVQ